MTKFELNIVESGRRAFFTGLKPTDNVFKAGSRARSLWAKGLPRRESRNQRRRRRRCRRDDREERMTLTEDQIERRIERMTDALDRRFMAGLLTQQEYDSNMADLRKWEDGQYFANERAGAGR